jgi:hypothetical protein
MKNFFRLIVCLLLLVGWGLAALSLHVIRTPGDIPIKLVPKEDFSFTDTYVDTTKWSLDDVSKHPKLVTKLIRVGKTDVLKHLVTDKTADVPSQLSDALQRGQSEEKAAPATTTAGGASRGVLGWILGSLK